MSSYEYDPEFYEYINSGSRRSAQVITSLVGKALNVRSVADFGCGQGAWLQVWQETGAEVIFGLDGDYVNQEALLVNADNFHAVDLTKPVSLDRKFDLVQSLEVAEHLPAASASTFVESLTKHGSMVMFSAAVPGQGGENHVNEQPYEYWRNLFLEKDYVLLDYIRPLIRLNQNVEPWYRYNTFLYVAQSRLIELPEEVRATALDDRASILDISPAAYKARKLLLRVLPTSILSIGARIKKIFFNNYNKNSSPLRNKA